MLLIWLKKKEEFQKLCQGKAVFFSLNDGYIHYFAPARANDVDVVYAFDSETPIPFREHYDFEDEKGVHVVQLTEINGFYFFERSGSLQEQPLEERTWTY
ncbi:MAG: hypothetical protein HXS54_03720 [Theionarchaea archaeon]|nr:hypothetical protein [Theionarchaea archaeon]